MIAVTSFLRWMADLSSSDHGPVGFVVVAAKLSVILVVLMLAQAIVTDLPTFARTMSSGIKRALTRKTEPEPRPTKPTLLFMVLYLVFMTIAFLVVRQFRLENI